MMATSTQRWPCWPSTYPATPTTFRKLPVFRCADAVLWARRSVPSWPLMGNEAIARKCREEGADMITFTSASTAANFMALGLDLPEGIRTASIGPVTSQEMRRLGLPVDLEASRHDIPGLVEAIGAPYAGNP